MKRPLMPLMCLILLAACNSKPANVKKTGIVDVISMSDNGVTYRDTLPSPNGMVTFVEVEDTTTEENSTGRFAPAGHKKFKDVTDSFFYNCSILKSREHSTFSLIYLSPASNLPVSFAIANAIGPLSGIGVYKAKEGETAHEHGALAEKLTPEHTFISYGKDGPKYTVDSAVVNITKAEGARIEGTFEIWATGPTGSKSLTGSVNCNVAGPAKYAAR